MFWRALTIVATFAALTSALATRAEAITLGLPTGLHAATAATDLSQSVWYGCRSDCCTPRCYRPRYYGNYCYRPRPYYGYGRSYGYSRSYGYVRSYGYGDGDGYGYDQGPYAWPDDLNWGYRTRWAW
jgi:hypothetical protein